MIVLLIKNIIKIDWESSFKSANNKLIILFVTNRERGIINTNSAWSMSTCWCINNYNAIKRDFGLPEQHICNGWKHCCVNVSHAYHLLSASTVFELYSSGVKIFTIYTYTSLCFSMISLCTGDDRNLIKISRHLQLSRSFGHGDTVLFWARMILNEFWVE